MRAGKVSGMDTSKDYYAILGVLPSIDQAALGAVYRALMKKYHPDVFSGSKTDAERISKELNEAYGVLGDAGSRAAYDTARKAKNANAGDYESQNTDDTDSGSAKDEAIERDWEFLVKYYPNAEQERKKLAAISRAVAFAFQMSILEAKNAAQAQAVSARMKNEFLQRYFGSNPRIHEFVLEAIADQRRDVAVEVNRAIKVAGTPSADTEEAFKMKVVTICKWETPAARRHSNKQKLLDDFLSSPEALVLVAIVFFLFILLIILGSSP